ncbi:MULTISPECIES: peptidase inhibitor family I36 protein [unclassified Kitasatospora]|uniref:peptidase inhibitor family I36 protein n=1 Tax=unclassified Kitasatospora TaxID=2633591 RepID=UPI003410CB6C
MTFLSRRSLGLGLAAAAAAIAIMGPGTIASASTSSPASSSAGNAWVQQQIKDQLKRLPGGVVNGNSIHYASGDVTLTYVPKAGPGTVAPHAAFNCPDHNLCLYTDTYFAYGYLAFTTGSEWCPGDPNHGMGSTLRLSNYGLAGSIRSVFNPTLYYARGYNVSRNAFGTPVWIAAKWTLNPNGDLNTSTDPNTNEIGTCPSLSQL